MRERFEMVAKTFKGLEEILAEEIRGIGATEVEPGNRMVSFQGDLETLYRANMCCRTALKVLKPFYKFFASSPDELYELIKEYNWVDILGPDKSFSVETVSNSEEFTHSRFTTYRVKDAIVDWFKDRFGDKRPRVSTDDPDIIINVHISGDRVTLSLDSSGESLHKRGYRSAQTEAPINEVLAAGIILRSGWRGEKPFVDPMCGSGTFLIEAALIAANINPGVFRSKFAFEKWKDFDADVFDRIYNDDSGEREVTVPIIGADISPKAIMIAEKNIKSARVHNMVKVEIRNIVDWDDAPANGVLITNPPYGERLNPDDLDNLYTVLGQKLKHVFVGYHAWILGYRDEHFARIGLAPSEKIALMNGALDCNLREYIIFEGKKNEFRRNGGDIKSHKRDDHGKKRPTARLTDSEWKKSAEKGGFGGKDGRKTVDSTSGERFKRNNESHSGRFKKNGGNSASRFFKKNETPGERFKRAFDRKESGGRNEDKSTGTGRYSESPYPFDKNKRGEFSFKPRQPQLPPQEGPIMRERRAGWKKVPNWLKDSDENQNNQSI